MTAEKTFDISSAGLHILAMVFMLGDHLWATIVSGQEWLTWIGRVAFPVFAFLIVEGYFHTRNLKRYRLRLFLAAVLAEIPFNLMCSGSVLFPFHQNVLWTFLIGLGLIAWNEWAARKVKLWIRLMVGVASVAAGYFVGMITMVDYFGAGVLTVLVFYFFHGRTVWCFLGQLAALYYLNVEVLGGLYYEVTVLGVTVQVVQQGMALLALLPIWLYQGRQGYHSKWFQYTCYAFYPVHMLVLYLLGRYVI